MPHPVPIGEYQSEVPVQEGLRRIIPEARGASIGPELEQIGDTAQQIVRSDAARYSAEKLSQTQSEWTQQLLDRQQHASPGAPNFTPTLMADYNAYVKDQVKGAPNALAGRFLQQHLNAFGAELSQRAMGFEAHARQAHNEETAKSAIDASSTELTADPSVFPQRLAQNQTLISQMNLDPEVKEKLSKYAETSMASFAVRGDISRDPYKAMLALQDPARSDYYKALTAEQREQLMDHADRILHQRVSDAERVHQLAKQQQSDNSDALLRQGIVMSQKGTLDADWVTKHASTLEPNALKYLYDQVGGKEDKTNPELYSDLLSRQTNGDDVRDDAVDAFSRHLLSQADFTKLMDKSAGEVPTPYKRGMDYINTAGQVSQLEPDPAKAQTLANMKNDFQDWYSKHRDAEPENVQAAAMDIVKRYQLVRADQNILTLKVPQFGLGKGSRAAPDIPGAKKDLVKAFKDQQIDRDTFNREAALLQKWESAVNASQAKVKARPNE